MFEFDELVDFKWPEFDVNWSFLLVIQSAVTKQGVSSSREENPVFLC